MPSSEYNKSERKQDQAKKQADDFRGLLESSFFDMNNKETMVAEMLLNYYIFYTGKVLDSEREKSAKAFAAQMIKNHGYEAEEGYKFNNIVNNTIRDYKDYYYNDFDVILAGDDGVDKLRNIYLDEIKKSDVYKAILNAKSQDELTLALNNAEEESKKGINDFETITLPKVSEPLNAKEKKAQMRSFHSLNRSVDLYLLETEWKEEIDEFAFSDLHIEGVVKNYKMIDSLYSDIKSLDSENSSPDFKNVLKSLEELRNLTEKFSKLGRPLGDHDRGLYKDCGRKVLENVDDYLYKTDKNASPDIENQINKVRNLKKCLVGNIRGLSFAADSVRDDIEKMALGEKMRVIDKYAVITYQHRHHFLGDHKLDELNGSIFSLGRSAGYSISVFALLNRGYSINDIMDSTKLHKEKREIFDEVLRRCKSKTEEDYKWLAKEMYDGFKKADKAMDEAYEKVDFTQDDFLQDENFAIMYNLSSVIFDVYQEQGHIPEYMNELAKNDPEYDYAKNPDFDKYRTDRKGVVPMMLESISRMRAPAANIYLEEQAERGDYQTLVGGALKVKYLLNILKENQHKMSYTELSVKKDSEIRKMAEGYLNDIATSYVDTFINERASARILYDKIFDTSIFNDVEFTPDAKDGIYVRKLPDEGYLVNMAKKYAKTKKNRLHKRQTEYKEASENISIFDDEDPFYTERNKVASQIGELNKKLEKLSPYNEDGSIKDGEKLVHKLSKNEINALIKLYQKSINEMHKLVSSLNDQIDELQNQTNSSHNVYLAAEYMRDIKKYENLVVQYDHISRTMSKDLRALQKAAKRATEVSLDTIFENSRVNSEYMVVGKVQSSNKGAQNERIPLTIAGKDGKNIKGYFTRDSKSKAGSGSISKAVNDAKKKYGKKASFLSVDNVMSVYNKFVDNNKTALDYLLGDREGLAMMGYEEAVKLLSKDMGKGFSSYINTPEKLNIFIDVVGQGVSARNQYNISTGIGINEKANVNRRNAALSKLAEFLGCGDVIAGAEDIRIKINGKYVKGTFMKEAVGEDINKLKKDSKMLRSTPLSGMSLELKKQIASLQIIDYLGGNPDRHSGNMLYYFVDGEDGAAYLKTITGIDNDSSFGSNDYDGIGMSSVKLTSMKVIPKELSDRILNLDPESLKQMLYGFDMTTREINNVLSRLTKLQDKLKEEAKEYAKGYTEGYIIPGSIKPVSDEELDAIPYTELQNNPNNKKLYNLFDRVNSKFLSLKNYEEYFDTASRNYNKAVYKYTVGKIGEMSSLISNLNRDTRFGGSSPKYDEMLSAMKSLNSAFCGFTGPVCGKEIDTSKEHVKSLMDLKDKITDTLKCVYEYLNYKRQKTKGEEWMLIEGPHEITREERRYRDAIQCRDFLLKHLEQFEELDSKRTEYNEIKDNYQTLSDEATKNDISIAKNEDYIRAVDNHINNLYKNHVSRTKYQIKMASDKLNIPKNKEFYKMSYDMHLGYGIFGIKPEERIQFRKEIEEYTNKKIELSDDELHKRAIACDMIITKASCLKKVEEAKQNKKVKVDETTKELLDLLKHIEIKPHNKAVDNLLNNDTFNDFYNSYKEDFAGFNHYKVPGVSAPDLDESKNIFKAYNKELYKKHPELNPEKIVNGPTK